MSSINLLPWRALAQTRRQRIFYLGVVVSSLLTLSVMGALHGAARQSLQQQLRTNHLIRQQITQLEQKRALLAPIKQQQRWLMQSKQVLQEVRLKQARNRVLFAELTAQLPAEIYLTCVQSNAHQLTLQGKTRTAAAVTAYMQRLQYGMHARRAALVQLQVSTDVVGFNYNFIVQLHFQEV